MLSSSRSRALFYGSGSAGCTAGKAPHDDEEMEPTVMGKLRVSSFAMSIDGFSAGPNQDIDNPLGVRGPELMEWFFSTRAWRKMHGMADGETGVDNEIAEAGLSGLGAWILGRNM